ncbi:MAG TPA: type VI secretion system contractile sheath large subunit [Rhodothermales bacterium]
MDDSSFRGVGIRITSDPDTTRVERPTAESRHRRVQLPLRLMVASDLAPGYEGPPFRDVDSSSFGDVMASLSPRLRIDVQNHIGRSPAHLELELSFRSMNDLRPERIARAIPAVATLLAVRSALDDLGAGKIDAGEFKLRLDEAGIDSDWTDSILRSLTPAPRPDRPSATRTPVASGDDAIDRLLGMIDVPGAAPDVTDPTPAAGSSGLFEALLGAATGSQSTRSTAPDGASVLASDLDESIGRQVLAVLEHPDFRRLEAAWRGLRFLIDRLDFRRDVMLDVLPAGREDLSEAVYNHVLMPEHRGSGDRPPLAALLVGHQFDASSSDVALLEDLAETGASLQIPVLASAAPSFFGVATGRGLEKLPPLRQHLSGPQWIAWQKLRDREEALNLALAVPGVLARNRYGPEDPAHGLSLEESEDLWIGGAYVVAAAIARSFTTTGWPTHIRGMAAGVEGLPLRRDSRGAVSTAAILSEDRQADFAEAGFVVVGCRLNRDDAFPVYAPTVRRAEAFDDPASRAEASEHASLPARLFLARVAQYALAFENELAEGGDLESARTEVHSRFRALMGEDDAVDVEAVGEGQLAIRLRPPASILEEPVSLVLGMRPGRSS